MPYLFFSAVCLIWGASFILMKKAGLAIGPITIGAFRIAAGATALGLMAGWRRGDRPLSRQHLLPLVGVAAVGFAWPYAIQPHLVRLHGSGFIGMSVSLVPLCTLCVAPLLLGVHPSRRQLIGVLGGFLCVLGMLGDGIDRHVPLSDLALAASVPICYALTNTYVRKRFVGVSSLSLSIASLGLAAGMLLPLGLALEPLPIERQVAAHSAQVTGESQRVARSSRDDLPLAVASILILGVLGTGLATYLFNRLVQEQGPLFAGMTTYLVPIGAVIWGWLDQEQVTPLQLVSLTGILAMVALVQYGAAKTVGESA